MQPRHVHCSQILTAPANRDGASPNVQYIHHTLLKNFFQKGFDGTRPAVGVLVKISTPEYKQQVLERNRKFSQGNPLMPPIYDEKIEYASLAASHLNIALRCIYSNTPSPVGNLESLAVEGTSLHNVIEHGHRWIILKETTPHREQLDVSLWRNADQNDNQQVHEIEIVRSIDMAARELAVVTSRVLLGDLVSKTTQRSPNKIKDSVLVALAKYYISFVTNSRKDLVGELLHFHAATVNPRELVLPHTFFEALAKEDAFKTQSLAKLHVTLAAYTLEKSLQV